MTGIPARPGEAAGTHGDMLENMDFREKKLYQQIHPLKLATDIGVTPLALLLTLVPMAYGPWNHDFRFIF